ncbi:MAG TPA: pilus assembly protein TadG-related protein [Candidatus Dormibacteraeota bacterium]|nr:pilus assembly protein TadG-related protein [Candidatus Dormibacteraeota bacterium]
MTRRNRRGQSGQAIVIIVGMIVSLTVLGVVVFDAGLAMSDRRNLQATADAAALAGARSYAPGQDNAHWVAMEYMGTALKFSLPTGFCVGPTNCPAGTYIASGYRITLADSWRYNGILNFPSVLDVVISHQQPSIFARMLGFAYLNAAASARATIPGPQFNGANYAVAAVSGDALINGGGAAFQTVTGPVYAYGSFGANNGPHSTGVPSIQTGYDGNPCPNNPANFLSNGGGGNSLNYHTTDGLPMPDNYNQPPPLQYENASPIAPSVTYTTPAAAKDVSGNWMPGIYSGFSPSGGKMDPGVYKITSASLNLGSITNATYTPSGTQDTAGAVALVIDGSDTGLNLSAAVLNGLDDVNTPPPSPRDPQNTHNFVIWGGGSNPYTAGVTIGPGATTDMSGIIYLPKSPYVSDGNSSPQFTGSLIVASMTVHGGGNGQQVFKWVCGLNAVAGQPYDGGLVR